MKPLKDCRAQREERPASFSQTGLPLPYLIVALHLDEPTVLTVHDGDQRPSLHDYEYSYPDLNSWRRTRKENVRCLRIWHSSKSVAFMVELNVGALQSRHLLYKLVFGERHNDITSSYTTTTWRL